MRVGEARRGSCRALFFALLIGGCSDDAAPTSDRDAGAIEGDSGTAEPDASTRVAFARDVEPIFRRCVICHHPGGVIGYNLVDPFDPEEGIVDRVNSWREGHDSPFEVVVKPGSADESFLIYKVEEDPASFDTANNGGPMPLHVPRVTDDERAKIRQWIEDGAKNDAFFSEQVAPILGTETSLGRRGGKCTYCHYPNSSTGLNILAVFDADEGLVGADSILSEKQRVAPGDPDGSFLLEKLEPDPSGGAQMPLHYERLSEDEVDTLRRWIDQGALDD